MNSTIKHESLKNAIASLLDQNRLIKEVFDKLNHTNNLFIFGGWVRDVLISEIHKEDISWKDIDIVVVGDINVNAFSNLYQNCFKGYKYYVGQKKSIHFWKLDQTYAFRKSLFEPQINNLTKSTVFRFNSVLYDYKNDILYEDGAIQDIKDKQISFNCDQYLWDFPELQIYRALDFKRRFNFWIDEPVIKFMKQYISKYSQKYFHNSIIQHKNWISIIDVEKIFNKIKAF